MLRPYRTFTVVPMLPPRLRPLRELAHNLWWSWHAEAIDLFRRLDSDLWEESGHNPVLMLGRIKQRQLEEAAGDDGFVAQMMRVYQAYNRYMGSTDTWFDKNLRERMGDATIAYFSAEFGITECLAMYSGGLGVLAGDHFKSASDLGMPMVGVGLLYQEGYFQQYLNADGWQQETYPLNDFYNLPIELQRDAQGESVRITVAYPGRNVVAQVWSAQVGRVRLYLLDANLPENRPEDRAITGRLYGGDLDMRVRQEILLGIGGMRALRALGIDPTICHMNDGHPAFLALERIRMAMNEQGLTFAEARQLTAAGNVFTTHTPVPAGIDLFPPYLMDQYFTDYYRELGLNREQFLGLGRPMNPRPDEPFSMAVLALRLSSGANGVSELHGMVARDMWRNLWPDTPSEEVPIASITNGIHTRSWISPDMASLLIRYLGPRALEQPENRELWERVGRIPDEELWRTHERRRERLVAVARERLERQLLRQGGTPREIDEAMEVLNPEALTIGFARRFATYKRALLLFRDPDRLARILNQAGRPVQIIFAGKAHPRDNPGKEFIRQIVHLSRREDLRRRVIFLENYDINVARYMVQGVDIWLNTPRQGMEASGTSGMKAALNGGIHVSTLDGWWWEGYTPEVGWRIGSGEDYEDERYGDEVEAQALYDLLEKDIIPLFYDRTGDGLPRRWIGKMKNAMREVAPFFNTHRMVEDYAETLYLPAAQRYGRLAGNDNERARALANWLQNLRQHWGEVRIVNVSSDAQDGVPVSAETEIAAEVHLGALTPADVLVQAFNGTVDANGTITDYRVTDLVAADESDGGTYHYKGTALFGKSGLHGFTVRVLPRHTDLNSPYIPGLVVWAS
jgi:starch phosphorylase